MRSATLTYALPCPVRPTVPSLTPKLSSRRRIAHACRFAHSRIGDRYLAASTDSIAGFPPWPTTSS